MRRTHGIVGWMLVLCCACTGGTVPTALVVDGLGGGAYDREDRCGEAEPDAPACLFGEVFSDIRTSDALLITSETWITSVDALTDVEAQQLLVAVQQSSHTDVTTAAEALERVDQQEVRRMNFYEPASERWFVVYEYGVGDNSYGAFFDQQGVDVLASIHDGDLLSCSVVAAAPRE